MTERKEPTKNGERVHDAFCARPLGMLSDEAVLGQFAIIQRVKLRSANDLRFLNIPDDKIEENIQLLLSLDMGRRPDLALKLTANESRPG